MKAWAVVLGVLVLSCAPGWARSNEAWLKKVPQKERARVNPLAANARPATAAGAVLFHNNCARCHGDDAEGNGSRPSLRSEEVQRMTDGELFWILKNGDVFHGMPRWSGLPEQERWQIVTYIHSLPLATEGSQR